MVNFVGVKDNSKEVKFRNLLLVGALIGFTSILFHFTVVYFFGIVLHSVFLVGIFLAVGNFISLIFDIPIGVLQKYIKPKTSIVIGGVMVLISSLIFVKFIYFYDADNGAMNFSSLSDFLSSGVNILLLIIVAGLYGINSEVYGVTTYSYILNIASPSEYARYLSKYNVWAAVGNAIGLVFSGILLAWDMRIAIIVFIVIISLFILFVLKYFNNGNETITLDNLKKIKLDSMHFDIGKKAKKLTSEISTKNLMELTKKTEVLFLKPIEATRKIDFNEVYETTVDSFKKFFKVIFENPKNLMMLWLFVLMTQISFWDTFVATYFVEFIEETTKIDANNEIVQMTKNYVSAYIWLGLIALPGFALQDPFVVLSQKIGEFKILIFGALTSGLSLVFLGFFSGIITVNFTMILALALINSVGYAAIMGVGQGLFSSRYNVLYAMKNNLKQIDSTVSAAPLKIILNLANVIGLLMGSVLVIVFKLKGFFVIFGGMILAVGIYSIINYLRLKEAGKEGEDKYGSGKEEDNVSSGNDIESFDGEVF